MLLTRLSRLWLAALVSLALVGPGASVAQAQEQAWSLAPADESAFVASINAARAAQGLDPLTVDTNMRAAARDWAIWMAENEVLQHASNIITGAPADWTKVGENVGRGGSVPSVWGAFMASPGHAANVLDASYTRVGVGMVWTDEGILYTTHRFAAVQSDSAPPPPPTPTPAPDPTPAPTAPPTTTPTPAPTAQPSASTPAPAPSAPPTNPTPTSELESSPRSRAPSPERVRATMAILLAATG